MEYYCIYQVQSSNHSQNRKLKSEINNTCFKISIIQMNTHLKESFLSRTTQFLAWQVKVERSEVFMGGFGKNFPLERFVEFLREYHKFITCLPIIIKFEKGWGGIKIITIFFPIIINFK